MKKILSLVIVLSMLVAPVAFAASSPWTTEDSYGEKTIGKLGYGVTNTLLGWTKLFTTPNQYSNEGKNVWEGVGQGVIDLGMTTVLGAVQLATFFIPADVPIPSPVNLSGTK